MEGTGGDGKENFDFEEGDFTRTIVNRIPAIDFSDRNRVSSLWRPSKSFQFMDVENGYFLSNFKVKRIMRKCLLKVLGLSLVNTSWFNRSHGILIHSNLPNGRCDLDSATRSTWLSVQQKNSGGDRGNDRQGSEA
ncbi:hypothetical protein Gorai_012516 [Gossypium raimondii]|uniref:DUF4283 domain-containing protein n=1 Tax=Gossypium raimondii TaxID=29730 RepID=A0A7J8Q2B9_GOSRA|nr:hypothetical protein [Gossypium raimondii]